MGNLVFQATLGGQVNLVGPNTASTFNINVPTVNGNMVTTGDTGTVTNTMLASSAYTAPGTIGSGTPNTGAFTTLSASGVASFAAGSASAPALTRTGDTNTGIFFPAADTIAFAEGGVEAMRLDSSGNLGLGVTPSAYGSGAKAFEVNASSTYWGYAAGGVYITGMSNNTYGAGSTNRYKNTATAGEYSITGNVHAWYNAASGTAGNAITFTQAMTLDASGNLLVGTTSGSARVGITGSAVCLDANSTTTTAGTQVASFTKALNSTATSNVFVQFNINGGAAGSGQINANGASQAAFGSFSDQRLKENIVNLPSQLSKVLALRPVEFDYIETEGGGHQTGFIAQEMQGIFPDAVGERNDGMLTITGWNKTEAILVKAIQEQQALITSQSELITQLQADVAALKGQA